MKNRTFPLVSLWVLPLIISAGVISAGLYASTAHAEEWIDSKEAQKAKTLFESNPSKFEKMAALVVKNPSLQGVPAKGAAPERGSVGPYGKFNRKAVRAFKKIQKFVQDQKLITLWVTRYADTEDKRLSYLSFVTFSRTTDGLLEEFYINKYVDPDVTDIEIRANSCRPLETEDWYVCIRR